MKQSLFTAAALATALVLVPHAGLADSGAARDSMNLNLGYDGKLLVRILSIEVQQEARTRDYQSTMHITAEGPLAAFRKLDVRARTSGRLNRGDAKPVNFSYDSRGKKGRQVSAQWTGDDVVATASPAFKSMGEPPANRNQRLESADPLTQMMRFALADNPCTGSARFFDGKQRYNLVLSSRGPGELDEKQKALGLVSPIRCTARYEKVAGFKADTNGAPDALSMRDMPMSFARVGADGPWVITQMTVGTALGPAQLKLARVSATGAEPDQLARLRNGGGPG
jgi:hypothetical protein